MPLARGSDAGDQLRGAAQRDIIIGLGGDDRITGEGGSDWLFGGGGGDRLYGDQNPGWYDHQLDRWVEPIDGVPGDDLLNGGDGADELYGGAGNDLLIGGDGSDYLEGDYYTAIHGDNGDDLLIGGDGADTLAGSRGDDTLMGGAGDDLYLGWNSLAAVYVFEAREGGFGHDRVDGYHMFGSYEQLRFVGYTEADLAGPIQAFADPLVPHPHAGITYQTRWQFDFKDGSRVTVVDENMWGDETPTAPVAGQDYVFA